MGAGNGSAAQVGGALPPAPFFQLSGTLWPAAEAFWTQADDGIRLRLGLWRAANARHAVAAEWLAGAQQNAGDLDDKDRGKQLRGSEKRGGTVRNDPNLRDAGEGPDFWLSPAAPRRAGTVLLFPGRTEYIEKYAPVAGTLTAAGLDVLAIDWRGQGASDRLLDDPSIGHVTDFSAYQRDVAAMLAVARARDLPRPWHLLAHSMGGCIGLRSLTDGLDVASAVFSAPMWGIRFGRLPDPLGAGMAGGLARAARRAGRGPRAIPAAGSVLDMGFTSNPLTGDLEEFIRLMRETAAWPGLRLGPASYDWVRAALAECRDLSRRPPPRACALITLSGAESIVSTAAIRAGAARWAGSRLLPLPGARHEALFEVPAIRAAALGATLQHFAAA